ncbi:MAG: hypothetical protein LBI91_00125 [Spirochaetaceae bacterium]|jgi:hypothetical protein|nr:hypothetical protein [Spirochaetaceae bacterium]
MRSRAGASLVLSFFSVFLPVFLEAESFRTVVAGTAMVSVDNPDGVSIPLSIVDSALIALGREIRFFRGVELEFTVPQNYLPYRGSMALSVYGELDRVPETGVTDLQARQIFIEPIQNKIQSVYQIPLRQRHGLRSTPYVAVIPVTLPSSFPLLFRVMPLIKGLTDEVEALRFVLNVKPILSDEGAVRVVPRYPDNLPDKPFTLLIDDEVIDRPREEQVLREGEHHLLILSNDYRNESRVFMVERGRILELGISLQDPTPLIIFEAPENARIYFDNAPVDPGRPLPVEPGPHEVRFQLSDYAVVKPILVQKGKTYRVAMAVDLTVTETD